MLRLHGYNNKTTLIQQEYEQYIFFSSFTQNKVHGERIITYKYIIYELSCKLLMQVLYQRYDFTFFSVKVNLHSWVSTGIEYLPGMDFKNGHCADP